jgi:hypothetical protein
MITEKGMDAGRVGECRATVDPQDEAPPRAEVTI